MSKKIAADSKTHTANRTIGINVNITNAITGEKLVQNRIEVPYRTKADKSAVEKNWNVLQDTFPECHVNFYLDNGSFFLGAPREMMADQERYASGEMTFEEYDAKWYGSQKIVS